MEHEEHDEINMRDVLPKKRLRAQCQFMMEFDHRVRILSHGKENETRQLGISQ